MQIQSPATSHQQTGVQPVSKQSLLWKEYPLPNLLMIVTFQIYIWSVGAICPGCVPSKIIDQPQ